MAKNQKVESKRSTPAVAPARTENAMLTLIRVKPNGSATYGIPGVAGSVRVAKGLLLGAPPASLSVVNDGVFKQPDPEKAAKLAARAERKAQVQVTREERAAKAAARAAKAQERARKALAHAEKLAAKLAKAPEIVPA